jgi:multiple sugar transport system permease protein
VSFFSDTYRRFAATSAAMWIASGVMLCIAATTFFPILFTLNTSLKPSRDYMRDGIGVVARPTLKNFETAWSSFNMSAYFLNSLIVTVIGVATVVIVASLAGYALALLSFRFKRLLFIMLLSGLIIPVQAILVPLMQTIRGLHMLNSHLGLGIIYGAFFSPFGVYLMTAYYSSLPRELMESAKIDGASLLQTYLLIVLPLGTPALFTLSILTTLHCWNDILLSLLVMQEQRTLMVGIASLQGEYSADIPLIAAAVVIGAAPVIAVFLFFQRKILGGITVGAVKG